METGFQLQITIVSCTVLAAFFSLLYCSSFSKGYAPWWGGGGERRNIGRCNTESNPNTTPLLFYSRLLMCICNFYQLFNISFQFFLYNSISRSTNTPLSKMVHVYNAGWATMKFEAMYIHTVCKSGAGGPYCIIGELVDVRCECEGIFLCIFMYFYSYRRK